MYWNNIQTTIKQNFSREKRKKSTEEKLIINTQLGYQTSPIICCGCCYCYFFGTVSDTTDAYLKINITTNTKYLTHNKNKISMKNARTCTVLKYAYSKND